MSGQVATVTAGPVVHAVEPTSLLDVISRAASDPSVDVDKMERLMQMHERMTQRKAETAFNSAMAEAQAEMRRVATDSYNPQTRSRYASYASIDRAIRPVYVHHGFSVSFTTEGNGGDFIKVVAIVAHKDGFTRRYEAPMPSDGKGAKGGDVMTKTHAFGAAATYGMRYLLKLIFNVAIGEDDNDGNEPEPEISPMLKALRQEAMKGTDALRAAFNKYKEENNKEFDSLWEKHGKSLKADATQAPGAEQR